MPVPQKLSLHSGNTAENWKRFKNAWFNYEIAAGFEPKSGKIRVATLLSVIGEEAVEVFETFEWSDDADKVKIEKVLEKFEKYCIPRANLLFETFRFGSRLQNEGENVDSYVTVLRKLAASCAFQDVNRRIRDQLVLGLRDARVRERILREMDPDLQKVIDIIRANEMAETQSKEINSNSNDEEAHHLKKGSKRRERVQVQPNHSRWKKNENKVQPEKRDLHVKCKFCARQHERRKEKCPAWQKKCNSCGQMNHFSKCCQKSNSVEKAEIVQIFGIDSKSCSRKTKTLTVCATGKKLTFQIDTGASCNVISYSDYKKVTGDQHGQKLAPNKIRLVSYGGKSWNSVGTCKLRILSDRIEYILRFVVVSFEAQPLLSLKSSEELGIVKILNCDQETVAAVSKKSVTRSYILTEYSDVFSGLGKLKGKYKIAVDENVNPVVHPPRKVPVALRDELKLTLDQLVKDEIIEPVTKPTEWVSSMMLVKKPGKLRICLDPKDLNRAIRREHYPLPTIEDVATRLKNAKVFSVLDAKNGFWQVELDEESRALTTFNTPFGRFQWKRMPFGICSAPEVWQRKMHEFAEGLTGIEVIADDFLVCGFGDTHDRADEDHDRNLMKLLEKARKENLKLNPKKLKLKMEEVPFIGHILTREGVKIDPSKVEAITKMPVPQDVKDLMRFLGMVQYVAKFLPKLSTVTEPLRRLTDKDATWKWTAEHEKILHQVKVMLTEAPVLVYYDSKKPVTIQSDASDCGLGSVLLQEGRPVAYSSRAMTPTEKRYAQIEKEMLAIVHGCTKFDQYIYGRDEVRIETDHKPLEVIMRKPIESSPRRLQRMLLFLQKYPLKVEYKKGSELYIADTLSRAYLEGNGPVSEIQEVLCVQERQLCWELERIHTASEIPNSKSRIEEIRKATLEDEKLKKVRDFVNQGWPEEKNEVPNEVHAYFSIRDELIEEDRLLFKGVRVVIPDALRKSTLKNLHASHIGIEGTLRRAREVCYWPGMNSQIKDFIAKCDVCNSLRSQQSKEPMMSHEVPSRAWSKVSADLFEYCNEQFIIAVDHYSNYFEVENLSQTTTMSVIKTMKKMFSRFGIPENVITDNGPQFSSREFRQFAKDWLFDHTTSSPLYPQANGKAENAVKTCKTLMKKAKASNTDFLLSLLEWRNTPSAEIGLSPAQRMFGRRARTLLPVKEDFYEPIPLPDVKKKIEKSHEKQAKYYDRGSIELVDLQIGDTIRMKLPGQKVWTKGIVLSKEGKRSYKVKVRGSVYRRNRRQLIKTDEQCLDSERADPDSYDEDHDPGDSSSQQLRRSTRVRRLPSRFRD